jgi:disulfide bond formation protein DsbB
VDEESTLDALTTSQPDSTSAESSPSPSSPRKRVLGMTPAQWMVIAVLGIAMIAILAVFAYLVLRPLLP